MNQPKQRNQPDPSLNQWSEGPIFPRWAFWILVPGLVGPLLIFGFIYITEGAHNEARCPYTHVTTSTLSDGRSISEERRECVTDVEERRFTVVHGAEQKVLGRRRFPKDAFAAPKYSWSATVLESGEAQVTVHNPGHDDGVFREGKPGE
jgi:hypothetical protein